MQKKKNLKTQIREYKDTLETLETPGLQAEKTANTARAKEVLNEQTKEYEKKFACTTKQIKAYLLFIGALNCAQDRNIESIVDGTQVLLGALQFFETNKDNSYFAVENLLNCIPKQVRKKHYNIIKGMLSTIGSKPVFKKKLADLLKTIILLLKINYIVANKVTTRLV